MVRTVLLLLLFVQIAGAQTPYNIAWHVDGLADTTVYLGYYYNGSPYVKDTATVDAMGKFAFTGKKQLEKGIYFLVKNKQALVDFVVGDDQDFLLKTHRDDYAGRMVVKGDRDNELFFKNLHYDLLKQHELKPIMAILKDTIATAEARKNAEQSFLKLRGEAFRFQDGLIASHPMSVTASFLKAIRPIEIPEPPTLANGAIDSTFRLRWYRQHFFDNFDLGNDVTLKFPGNPFRKKINEYLDQLFLQQPDSLLKAIDQLVSFTKGNREVTKNIIFICMGKYERPQIMGLDEVFVGIYDRYFATGAMNYWANEVLRKNLKEAASRIRTSMVGRTGDNLIMLDEQLNVRSMYDIKKRYTLLWIFDPDCGHCREETPKLVSFYNEKKFDAEVYAVCLDSSLVKMKGWIKDLDTKWITVNGPRSLVGPVYDHYDCLLTPALYVLDEKKKIIARKLSVEQLDDFLSHYERLDKKKG